jgi:hypothetical protein
MIDFNSLSRPERKSRPLDPLEIFAKTPNLKDAPNSLWIGQAEALQRWHADRAQNDNAIILNTGAEKSLVGILIAQSLVNEEIGPIVYACSTIDLVEQTVRECARLGIPHTTRVRTKFSNDLFETGRAFCITTYQALFSSITTFRNEKEPAGVIFDDAHVAERLVRDAFTLSIPKADYPKLYSRLLDIIRPEFDRLNKGPHLNYVVVDLGQQSATLCPRQPQIIVGNKSSRP